MKIALFGTFDVSNYGDCIFPLLVQRFLGKRVPSALELELCSPTSRVAQIGEYPAVNAVPDHLAQPLPFRPDALVLAGGDTLVAKHSVTGVYCGLRPKTLCAGLRLWIYPAAESIRLGVPWAVHSVGNQAIPADLEDGFRQALNGASYVSVRDRFSQSRLEQLGITAECVTDIGFGIPQLHSLTEWARCFDEASGGMVQPGGYIVVQASRGYLTGRYDEFVKAIVEISRAAQKKVLFLPICRQLADHHTVRRLYRQCVASGTDCAVLARSLTTSQTAAILGHSAAYVGTSLHGAITSLAFGLPAAVYVHEDQGKHRGTLEQAGYAGLCTSVAAELPGCLQRAQQIALEDLARSALENVESGFDRLWQSLRAPRTNCPPNALEILDLAASRHAATYPAGILPRAKRLMFCTIRRNDVLLGAYERLT